jgi:hypothetical protein
MKKISKINNKKLPHYQNSGLVNNTGYTPNTPSYNNPMNIIPSGDITMENTPIQLLAFSDSGEARILNPGEKHKFSGKNVVEIPVSSFLYNNDPQSLSLKETYFNLAYGKNPTPMAMGGGDPKKGGERVTNENGVITITGDRIPTRTSEQFNPDTALKNATTNAIVANILNNKDSKLKFSKGLDSLLKSIDTGGAGKTRKERKGFIDNIFDVEVGDIKKYQDGNPVVSLSENFIDKHNPKYTSQQEDRFKTNSYNRMSSEALGNLASIGTMGLGSGMYATANMADNYSNEKMSAIGMGLQAGTAGARLGSMLGPLGTVAGGALGGIGGAAMGWYTAKNRNIEMEEAERRKELAYMNNAQMGVDKGIYKDGGPIIVSDTIPIGAITKERFDSIVNSRLHPVMPKGFPKSNINPTLQNLPLGIKKDGRSLDQIIKDLEIDAMKKVKKLKDGGKTKDKFENTETYYSQMIMDKGKYIIPQMFGSLGTSEQGVPIVHIQTEKGEKAIMPDGGIVDTKATKLHEKMHKDKVTDVFPEGVYIASARDKNKIPKTKAEKEVLGHTPVVYDEFENHEEPKEIKFSDLYSKKEHTPAELAKIIEKRFKTTDRQNDAFAQVTNQENKIGRLPYAMKLIELAEGKKSKSNAEVPIAKHGGKVKKYQDSGAVELEALYKNYADQTQKFNDKYQQEYADYYKYARGANAAANVLGAVGTGLQSSAFTPAFKSNKYANEMFGKVPHYLRESGINEAQKPIYSIARNLGILDTPTSSLMGRLAPITGQAINSANATNRAYNMDDINMDRQKARYMQGTDDYNVAQSANAENFTRRQDNQKISQITGFGGRTLTGDATLRGQQLGSQMQLERNSIDQPFSMAAQLAMMRQQNNLIKSMSEGSGKPDVINYDPNANKSATGGSYLPVAPIFGPNPIPVPQPSVPTPSNPVGVVPTPTPVPQPNNPVGVTPQPNQPIAPIPTPINPVVPTPQPNPPVAIPQPSDPTVPKPKQPNTINRLRKRDVIGVTEPLKPKGSGVYEYEADKMKPAPVPKVGDLETSAERVRYDEDNERYRTAQQNGEWELENSDGSKRKVKYNKDAKATVVVDKDGNELIAERLKIGNIYVDENGDIWETTGSKNGINGHSMVNILDTFETEEEYAKHLRTYYESLGNDKESVDEEVNRGVNAYKTAQISRKRRDEKNGNVKSSGGSAKKESQLDREKKAAEETEYDSNGRRIFKEK